MSCEIMQKGVSNSRLVRQLLVPLVMAALLLSGCKAAFPVYPGAKSDQSSEGFLVSFSCFASGGNLIVAPGEKVEINPQIYSTDDSPDTVWAWYQENLTEWGWVGTTCENGTSYVFPKECNATPEPCEKQLNIIEKDSGGAWIVVYIR